MNKIIITSITLLLASCVASVSTSTVKKEGMSNEKKGRELLQKSWQAHGMSQLAIHDSYQLKATDHWKGLMGSMGKIWPEKETTVQLDYVIGTFDGRATLLTGKEEGLMAGLQSWNYYEQEAGADVDFDLKDDARYIFGIAAYQYFFELPDRLLNAPLITYAGEEALAGKSYDLVFVTWEKLKAHKKHDQYLCWINKETGMMDYCEFTVHDSYLPGGGMIPASIQFTDMRDVDGFKVPFLQYIFIGSPKEKTSKYLHRLTVDSFAFDVLPVSALRPNSALKEVGDDKPG